MSQEPVNPFGVATTSPAGNVSVKPTPVNTIRFGFVRLKVRLVVAPSGIVDAPNALTIIIGAATTVIEAVAAFPGPNSLDVTNPVTLVWRPVVTPWTFTINVHPAGATVAPARLMLLDPATAVIVPPQEPVNPFGVATTSPAGNVSLKPTPVNGVAFGFVILKVRLVVPPNGIVSAAAETASIVRTA